MGVEREQRELAVTKITTGEVMLYEEIYVRSQCLRLKREQQVGRGTG
jgi:hypothetical protein